MKKQPIAQVTSCIEAHIAHNNDKTSGHLENALRYLDGMTDEQLTVRSKTSGNLLPARVLDTSSLRRFLGSPHIKMVVLGANLKGLNVMTGWYKNTDISQGFAR